MCRDLAGEYAFALWDGERRRLVLGCDPFVGKIVFRHERDRVVVARSAREVLQRTAVDIELNGALLAERVRFGTPRGDATAFMGVQRVGAGTVHVFTKAREYPHAWWHPRADPAVMRLPAPEQVAVFREALKASVEARLPEEGNCGVLLSGGLDSTILAASAAPALAAQSRTVVGVSNVLAPRNETDRDERAWASLAARHLGIPIHFTQPVGNLTDGLDQAFVHTEAFEVGLSQWAHFRALATQAREAECNTALVGIGGEIVATSHGKAIAAELIRKGRWRDAIQLTQARCAAEGHPFARAFARDALVPQLPAIWQDRLHRLRRNQRANLRELPPLTEGARRRHPPRGEWTISQPPTRQGTAQSLVGVNQGRRDFTGAFGGTGVGLSFPFLDPRVIDTSLAADIDLHTYRGLRRGLARRAFADVLPPAVVTRADKVPFAPDHHSQLRAEAEALRSFVLDRRELPLVREWVDVEAIDAAFRSAHALDVGPPAYTGPLLLTGHVGVLLVAFLDWFTRFREQIHAFRRQRLVSAARTDECDEKNSVDGVF